MVAIQYLQTVDMTSDYFDMKALDNAAYTLSMCCRKVTQVFLRNLYWKQRLKHCSRTKGLRATDLQCCRDDILLMAVYHSPAGTSFGGAEGGICPLPPDFEK